MHLRAAPEEAPVVGALPRDLLLLFFLSDPKLVSD